MLVATDRQLGREVIVGKFKGRVLPLPDRRQSQNFEVESSDCVN